MRIELSQCCGLQRETTVMSNDPVEVDTKRGQRHVADRGNLIGGVVIIAIGVLLLVAQNVDQVGQYVPLLVGASLMLGFVVTRQYGFLVPGAIVSGVGVGIVLVANDPTGTRGPLFLVALGLGFISIWVLGGVFQVPENHWWPIVPGGILLLIGAIAMLGEQARQYLDYWPLVLVVIGMALVARAVLRRQSG